MFEIGWTEMLVIAVVMIVVVGPKDLPKMLRTFGRTAAKLRGMAGDFQKQFNEALKEAELDDVKKSVDSLRSLNPANEIKKSLNPFEKAAADVRAGLQSLNNPPKPAAPAATAATAAEPLKTGATAMPGADATTSETAAPAVPTPAETPAATVSASPEPVAAPAKAANTKAAVPAASKPKAAAKGTPAKSASSGSTSAKGAQDKGTQNKAAKDKPAAKTRKTAGSAT